MKVLKEAEMFKKRKLQLMIKGIRALLIKITKIKITRLLMRPIKMLDQELSQILQSWGD
jgi:hypothetical protein